MQARLADADIYLGESTSLELRINGIRNPEPPDLTHPDIDITKAGGQSFSNSSYTMINGQIRQTRSSGTWRAISCGHAVPGYWRFHRLPWCMKDRPIGAIRSPCVCSALQSKIFYELEVSSNKSSYVLGETVTLTLDLSIRKLTANGAVPRC